MHFAFRLGEKLPYLDLLAAGWALLVLEVDLLAKLVRYLRSGPVYLRSICFYLLNGIIWKI